MTKITVNGFSLNVTSYENTFLISNKEVAEGFGVAEETIRYQKTQGSSEYFDGIHFTTVGNPNGGLEKTMWTKKGIILLGFRLLETAQTIAFRDWATDFILERDSSSDIQQNSNYRLHPYYSEMLSQIWSDQKLQVSMMHTLIENMPVTNLQQNELKRMKNEKVEEFVYHVDKQLTKEAHRKIWSLFKQHFHLPRYNELPQSKFEDGKNFILSLSFMDIFPNAVIYTPPALNTPNDNYDEIPL